MFLIQCHRLEKELLIFRGDSSKKGLWLSHGAGSTPSLMGFGDNENHLVVLTDAGNSVKVMTFYRDAIPADAKKVEGAATKRLAAATIIAVPDTPPLYKLFRKLRSLSFYNCLGFGKSETLVKVRI